MKSVISASMASHLAAMPLRPPCEARRTGPRSHTWPVPGQALQAIARAPSTDGRDLPPCRQVLRAAPPVRRRFQETRSRISGSFTSCVEAAIFTQGEGAGARHASDPAMRGNAVMAGPSSFSFGTSIGTWQSAGAWAVRNPSSLRRGSRESVTVTGPCRMNRQKGQRPAWASMAASRATPDRSADGAVSRAKMVGEHPPTDPPRPGTPSTLLARSLRGPTPTCRSRRLHRHGLDTWALPTIPQVRTRPAICRPSTVQSSGMSTISEHSWVVS